MIAGLALTMLVLSAGALTAVVVAGIGMVKGIEVAVAVAAWAWRRRRVPRAWLPAGAWLAWWRLRRAAVPRDGEPLDAGGEALLASLTARRGDREAAETAAAEHAAEAMMREAGESEPG